jgi:hypothetical protein
VGGGGGAGPGGGLNWFPAQLVKVLILKAGGDIICQPFPYILL